MFGLPMETAWMLIWPFINLTAAFIAYSIMKKQDEQIDDREYGDEYDLARFGPLEEGKDGAK
ncbi:MAG: hypothetical protein Q4C80_07515 [Bacillota bacterium]|nr:hypothetical protein [Bacillota bacterium]